MLFKKRFLLKVTMLCVATILASCSSDVSRRGSSSSGVNTSIDLQKFGAKYKDRSYTTNLFSTMSVDNYSGVVNQGDFLTQLSNVRTYSTAITSTYAENYSKVMQWVISGADVTQLENYGIRPQVMAGEDGYQNVLLTGYYSPVIHARRVPQGQYQHPIYALPSQKRFTRAQIYQGALVGQGLELAYSDSMLDNFLLGVQGSGYVDFGDGNLNYFAYAGQNGYKYQAIGRLLVEDGEIAKEKMSIQAIRDWAKLNPSRLQSLLERNPSYVFFKNDPAGKVKGSAGVPLVPLASVASDRNIIPSGSILLVEIPQIDDQGNWTGKHKLHLMIALDVGGAVKGNHFDLYQGVGDKAGHVSGLLKHYGRVWILR
ncbi:murein transglycosylase A [Mannheimia massilioguelmaensis]|uniref:murein transglycosylase A n=1 Tax=Mannheimia massilioguelmaensis TaxID=1604354 RepID=UPI0005C93EB1|nr:murein transglycosylase A [Mannheimia massilioguelmaensis]